MRNSVIKEAREWVGTPYHHQAYLKYVGCDCVGLIIGVGRNSHVLDMTLKDIKSFEGYGRVPNPKRMGYNMRKFLIEVEGEPKIGDIAWIQWREGMPMHLAIISENAGMRTIIHAFRDTGSVVEHTLSKIWDKHIHSYWRYPGLN